MSSANQSPDRQLVDVKVEGVCIDRVSGARADRPGLCDLVASVREGDEAAVHSLDRLARDLDELRSIV